MRTKRKLIGALAIIFIVAISVLIHEGVHWAQASIDNRVEPQSIMFGQSQHPMTDFFGDLGFLTSGIAVQSLFTTNDAAVIRQYQSEWWMRELLAYSIQGIFIFASLLLIFKPFVFNLPAKAGTESKKMK